MKEEMLLGSTGGLIACIVSVAVGSIELFLVLLTVYSIALLGNVATGVFNALKTDMYSRVKATHAVYMKMGMIIAIVVVAIMDLLLMGLSKRYNIPYNNPLLTSVFVGYQIVHEFSSMLENIKKLGNKIPSKLEDVVKDIEDRLDKGETNLMDK